MSKVAQAPALTFEDALGKLESIVETMEGGELPLEQLLAQYEEGTQLVKLCQEKLAAAEIRIRQLEPKRATCDDGDSIDNDPADSAREPEPPSAG